MRFPKQLQSLSTYIAITIIFAVLILFFSFSVPAHAATLTVNTLADSSTGSCTSTCSLRDALAVATAGDTITFQSGLTGTITLTSGELVINKNITITGPGASVITVNGNNAGRVFHVVRTVTASMSGLTITNGNVPDNDTGGGILMEGTNLTASGLVIHGNHAQSGAGVFIQGYDFDTSTYIPTSMTITDSTIQNNSVTTGGGAGLYNNGGSLTAIRDTITGNHSTVAGAIYNQGLSDPALGIGVLTLANSTVANNQSSEGYGGGIYSSNGYVSITNTTLSGNTSPDTSGGDNIYGGAVIVLKNTIVAGALGRINCFAAITDNGNNLQYPGTTCGTTIQSANPQLGPLTDNGGPTQTIALTGTSPAVDGGDNTACAAAPVNNVDQRGVARPINGDDDGISTCDIGAYEAPAGTSHPPTATITPTNTATPASLPAPVVNNLTDVTDGICDSSSCSLRDAISNATTGATVSFAPGLTGTITLTSGELVISKNMTITGPGASVITISGNNTGRVFHITRTVTASMSGLTIANGNVPDNDIGGGILTEGTSLTASGLVIHDNHAQSGAGIAVAGYDFDTGNVIPTSLTISDSTIQNNAVTTGGGGGIFNNFSLLNAVRVTIAGNQAFAGGAIYNQGQSDPALGIGVVYLVNTTVANNQSFGNYGGGIYSSNAYVSITNGTIYGNTMTDASTGGENIYGGSVIVLKNTIVGGSASGANCNADITDNGNNLQYPGSSCGATILSKYPMLGPLANNGGPTQTMALLGDNPAIDTGDNSACAAPPVNNIDQRGVARPIDGNNDANPICDVGAYEAPAGTSHLPTATATPTSTPTPASLPAPVVNNLTDITDGVCDTSSCSLRDAISNAASGATVSFAPGLTGTIVLNSQIVIDRAMTITGPGANVITLSGNNTNRIFLINAFGLNVKISRLTFINGSAMAPEQSGAGSGGAISNFANLTVDYSVFHDNHAYFMGGAIHSAFDIVINHSTFYNNDSTYEGGAIGWDSNDSSPCCAFAKFLLNSTLYNNTASTGMGGALFNLAQGHEVIANSTFTGNSAPEGGAIASFSDVSNTPVISSTIANNTTGLRGVKLMNSIVAFNTGESCNPFVTDGGNNIQFPTASCTTTIPVRDPKLGPLQNNGGPTWTMALLSGSKAIDAGNNAVCAATPVNNLDQRGMTRPVDGNNDRNAICDIGAYEAGAAGNPTKTPKPTDTPRPTKTLKPTDTPKPTKTQKPPQAPTFQPPTNTPHP